MIFSCVFVTVPYGVLNQAWYSIFFFFLTKAAVWPAVLSKAVVLLLLINCFMYPNVKGGSVFCHCFVLYYLMYFLVLLSSCFNCLPGVLCYFFLTLAMHHNRGKRRVF